MEIKNLQGAGAVTLGISAATVLTLDAGSYSGVISGAGQLVKTTTGPLTLAGANTYTGGTALSTGILLANNTAGSATGTGPVTIDSGATLGGKGKITGPATLESGGFIAPGVGASGIAGTTLHTASLIWNGGGALTLQLGATGDELALSGALTKGAAGTFTLDILNAGITKTTYTLATFTSTTFTLSDFTLDLPVNYTGTLVETSTSLILEDLLDPPPPAGVELPTSGLADNGNNGPTDSGISTVIPTPEPASTALLFLGVAALFGRRRRLRPPGAEIGPNLGPLISPTAAKKKPI
jgi:autotransporter-associated beta strand protein